MKKDKDQLTSIHTSLTEAVRSFSRIERVIFTLLSVLMLVSVIWILSSLNQGASVSVPAQGGTLKEGVLGSPRFVNPVLAESAADEDLVKLLYSGLVRSVKNEIIPDLAESYTVSPDGLVYEFILRQDAIFHDKTHVTADDVVFTIEAIQNSAIKSPRRASWNGVVVEKIDTRTVRFTLTQPYAGFLSNTTVGILPKHLWGSLRADQFNFTDLNIKAIGSGPYKIKRIKRTGAGVPEKITLTSFDKFVLGKPFINRIVLRFYANEQELTTALSKGSLEAVSSIDPETAASLRDRKKFDIKTTPLPRVFGMFFNQNEAPIFLNNELVKGINTAINKEAIVRRVLHGFGAPLEGPIPPNVLGYEELNQASNLTGSERTKNAGKIFDDAGWKLNENGVREKDGTRLAFSLATSNTPELKEVATMIKEQLAEVGVAVTIQVFETGNLEQDVIRPRQYQALLFGQVIQHDSDLFAFWHSSQRNDPGLNIALYTDAETDDLLTEALQTLDQKEREELYKKFVENIQEDTPAVFLYAPNFIYVTKKRVGGVSLDHMKTASDRWNGVYMWHMHTDNLWNIFTRS